MGHTPGRDHKRKSDPSRKRRFKKRAAKKKAAAEQKYEAAKKYWDQMSEDARKMLPELDPELIKPRWR